MFSKQKQMFNITKIKVKEMKELYQYKSQRIYNYILRRLNNDTSCTNIVILKLVTYETNISILQESIES